jgi:hypothetical protein
MLNADCNYVFPMIVKWTAIAFLTNVNKFFFVIKIQCSFCEAENEDVTIN